MGLFFKRKKKEVHEEKPKYAKTNLDKLEEGYENWARNVKPILLDIFEKRKRDLDGFEYSKGSPEGGCSLKLKLRSDGNFDVLENDEYLVTNGGRGFTTKDIIQDHWRYGILYPGYLQIRNYGNYYPIEERRELIKELKKRTGIDLRKEVQTRKKHGGLEQATATALIIGLTGGLFFLSHSLTGNTISDLSTKTTSFLGAGFLIIGLIAGFFWLKLRS